MNLELPSLRRRELDQRTCEGAAYPGPAGSDGRVSAKDSEGNGSDAKKTNRIDFPGEGINRSLVPRLTLQNPLIDYRVRNSFACVRNRTECEPLPK